MGRSEKSLGLTFVALSRLKKITDLLLNPIPFERLTNISKSKSLGPRIIEENRLERLIKDNLENFKHLYF